MDINFSHLISFMKSKFLILFFISYYSGIFAQYDLNFASANNDFTKHPEIGLYQPIRNQFQIAEEQIEKRTLKSKTFKNNDGSTTLAYSFEDMHYIDSKGWLRTISKQFLTDESNEAVFHQVHQKHPKSFDNSLNKWSITLSNPSNRLTFGEQISVRQLSIDKRLIDEKRLNEHRGIEKDLLNGIIKISNLTEGMDYELEMGNFYFKSNFIIKSKDQIDINADQIYFSDIIELPEGYRLSSYRDIGAEPDKSLRIIDPKGETILRFMPPVISDSGNDRYNGVISSEYIVQKIGNNAFEISIPVKASWLLTENRSFPVKIDPLVVFENNAQMNSCFYPNYNEESSNISIPEGNVILNTFLSWDFVAVAGTQAWTEDQRSFVSGPTGQTPVQIGAGSSSGVQTYNINSSIVNEVSNGEITLTWHAARTWGGSGCNNNFNFISRRYAEITFGNFETGEGTVLLNEYSCSNRQIQDDFGNFEDWVEFYNPNPFAVDLTGYYLSDNPNNPLKWRFPSGTILPQSHLVVICSGRDQMSGNTPHTNFRLSQLRPEYLLFSDPNGNILESYILITTQNAHSRGRLTDGASQWAYFPQPTPGAANQNGFINYTPKPVLDQQAGFYNSPINLQMSVPNDEGFQIRYTTNGTEPTANSTLYTGPVELNQTTVIRARCFTSDAEYIPGFIETNTYFINETSTLPVFSFSGNQLNTLFGGTQIRPIGAFEYFDANGEFVDESVGDFNKHGNDSWSYPQRGVDFICRDEYGYNEALKHPFFATSNRAEFQRLMVKAAANDNYPFENGGAYVRDAYIQTLSQLSDLDLDERSSTFVLLFVNGAYWGVYDLRERVDDNDYTEFYYGQERKFRGSDEYIQFLKTWGSTQAQYGNQRAINDWTSLVSFINQNDMGNEANYSIVNNQLNIESLIDYVVINSFVVSRDWLNYNTGWWRGLNTTANAQKWRYILWDMDAGLGHFINYTGMPNVSATAPPCQVDNLNVGNGHIQSLKKLIDENTEVREMYINRYADLLNTHFSCSNLLYVLDSMITVIQPEMPRQIQRWGGSMQTWQNNVQTLRNYINERCNAMPGLLANCYQLSGPENITFMVEPEGAGEIKMNSEWLTSYPFTASMFGNINSTFEARGNDFYTFSHWEISIPGSEPEQTQNPFVKNINQSGIIKAVFVNPFEIPDDLDLIYYWHFNNFNSSVDVKEIPADYKLISGTDPLMVYTGSGSRDIDPVNEGSAFNLQLNETEGRAARVRNPSEGRSLVFNLPTQGCTDLIFRYAVQRTNQGMLRNLVSYSTDGINFTQAGLSQTSFDISTDFQLVNVNFANATGVENNPNFHVRIEFEGNTNQDNGNNRFDNITLLGYYTDIGLSTFQPSGQLSIYPNPTKGSFIIESQQEISQIFITDLAGRIIRRVQGIQQPIANIDLSDSPSGIYFLDMMIGDKSYRRKIVKH